MLYTSVVGRRQPVGKTYCPSIELYSNTDSSNFRYSVDYISLKIIYMVKQRLPGQLVIIYNIVNTYIIEVYNIKYLVPNYI